MYKTCNFCGKFSKCKLCGKNFQAEGNLKRHIQKHMKKKVQLLRENFSDRRQFEESHEKKHEEKIAIFVGKCFGPQAI